MHVRVQVSPAVLRGIPFRASSPSWGTSSGRYGPDSYAIIPTGKTEV